MKEDGEALFIKHVEMKEDGEALFIKHV